MPLNPTLMTAIGTGPVAAPAICDFMQNPFVVAVGSWPGNSTASWTIEWTLDFSAVLGTLWNGTSAVWFTSALYTTPQTQCFSAPLAALRINIQSSGIATSTVGVWVAQAWNSVP